MLLNRRMFLGASAAGVLSFRQLGGEQSTGDDPQIWVCPMDPDVRESAPGVCPRCGMRLEARVVEPSAVRLRFATVPNAPLAGKPCELTFGLIDPLTNQIISRFETIHEKLFHLFVVRRDLGWFLHDHPQLGPDGIFRLKTTLPTSDLYELFVDLYPSGGSPQWLPKFIWTAGVDPAQAFRKSEIKPDLFPQHDQGVEVSLQFDPPIPAAARKTILFFEANPGDGIEPWLGSFAHAFWIKDDLIDAAHTHPSVSGALQFNVFFPSAGNYRFWLQFQRKGVLHTVWFTIPVIA